MSVLDTPATYSRLDPTGMHKLFAALPGRARESWAAGRAWELPADFHTPRRVVVLGVGGSAIGAEVIAALAARTSAVPVQLHRGYAAPTMDEDTLAVACSFSGETEETLAAFQGTLGQPGMRLTIGTGGRLAQLADEVGCPRFGYHWPGPPRTALADGLFPLLAILQRLGAIAVDDDELEGAFDALAVAAREWGPEAPEGPARPSPEPPSAPPNVAKQLARRLLGRVPVIIGADFLDVAARRWAAEINENSKQWAFHAALPEVDHNLVAGLGAPPAARDLLRVVLLDSVAVHGRNRLRVRLTAGLLDDAGVEHDELDAGGETMLTSQLRACYLGDWVSLYLALLNEIDPAPVPTIDALKATLSERE